MAFRLEQTAFCQSKVSKSSFRALETALIRKKLIVIKIQVMSAAHVVKLGTSKHFRTFWSAEWQSPEITARWGTGFKCRQVDKNKMTVEKQQWSMTDSDSGGWKCRNTLNPKQEKHLLWEKYIIAVYSYIMVYSYYISAFPYITPVYSYITAVMKLIKSFCQFRS